MNNWNTYNRSTPSLINNISVNDYLQFCNNYQRQISSILETQYQMQRNLNYFINNSLQTNNATSQQRNNTARHRPFTQARMFTIPLNRATSENIPETTNTIYTTLSEMISELVLNTNQNNTSFFDNVPIIPSRQQIDNACEIVRYQDISSVHDCCPITLTRFQQNDEVLRIKHCNHIFLPDNIRRWFTQSSRCPVCRYDIRDYSSNNNDISGNDNDISGNDNVIQDNINISVPTFTTETTTTTQPIMITTTTPIPNQEYIFTDTNNATLSFINGLSTLLRENTNINDISLNQTLTNLDFSLFNNNF